MDFEKIKKENEERKKRQEKEREEANKKIADDLKRSKRRK